MSAGFDDIPDFVLVRILCHLTIRDLMKIQATSRKIVTVTKSLPKWYWETLKFRPWRLSCSKGSDSFFRFLQKIAVHVKTISNFTFSDAMEPSLPVFVNLEHLQFWNVDPVAIDVRTMNVLGEKFPGLLYLDLGYNELLTPVWQIFGTLWPGLRSLTVKGRRDEYEETAELPPNLPQLEKLHCRQRFSPEYAVRFLACLINLPNLKELDIHVSALVSRQLNFGRNMSSLTCFGVIHSFYPGFFVNVSQMSNITTLKLQEIRRAESIDNSWTFLFSVARFRLSTLVMIAVETFNFEILRAIVSTQKGLKTLIVRHVELLGDFEDPDLLCLADLSELRYCVLDVGHLEGSITPDCWKMLAKQGKGFQKLEFMHLSTDRDMILYFEVKDRDETEPGNNVVGIAHADPTEQEPDHTDYNSGPANLEEPIPGDTGENAEKADSDPKSEPNDVQNFNVDNSGPKSTGAKRCQADHAEADPEFVAMVGTNCIIKTASSNLMSEYEWYRLKRIPGFEHDEILEHSEVQVYGL